MFVERFRAFRFGKVCFCVSGGFPELFLDECAKAGAELNDIRRDAASVSAFADERSFSAVRSAAERAGMDMRIVRRTGLPYFIWRNRRRLGIPIGLFLFILIISLSAGSVWVVDVSGNNVLTEREISDALEYAGLVPGTRKKDIDEKHICAVLNEQLPELLWVSVRTVGSKAYVDVLDTDNIYKKPEFDPYSNIVASEDGVIVRADILAGTGDIKLGSAVARGDLLISGVVEMDNGMCRFVDAKGIIEARTDTQVTASYQKKRNVGLTVRERDVWYISFFGYEIPLGIGLKDASVSVYTERFKSRKTVFPLGIVRKHFEVIQSCDIEIDDRRARAACFAQLAEKAIDRYKDADVVSVKFSYGNVKGGVSVKAEYECIENITKRLPLEVERQSSE